MAIWQYRFELVPQSWVYAQYGERPSILSECLVDINDEIEYPKFWQGFTQPTNLLDQISLILPRSECSFEARFEKHGSDIGVGFIDDNISYIGARFDLRTLDLEMLNQFCLFANRLRTFLVSEDRGTVVFPDLTEVANDIKLSDAYRFCSDPKGFIENISNKDDKSS